VSLTAPIAGQSLPAGQPVTITATASGAAALARVEIDVDGVFYLNVANPQPGATSMQVNQTWTSNAAGQHSLSLTAYDVFNTASPAFTISIQLTAPATLSAGFTSPGGNAVYQEGDSITLAYFGQAIYGVSRLELWVDGALLSTNADASNSTTFNLQQSWSSTVIGEHSLFVRVYDTRNQSADSATLTIGLTDRNPPAVTLASPANGAHLAAGQTVQVAATASDSKGIVSIQLWVDNVLVTTWTSGSSSGQSPVNTNLAWPSPGLGNHSLYLVAKDSVGLTTNSAVVIVTIDPAATATPTPTATKPTPTHTATHTATPTATRTPTATAT
jgi:hypothetical protein